MSLHPKRKAFTLVELLAVVVIIGVLMAIVFPAIIRAITDAEKTSVRREVSDIERAIGSYMTKYGCFPHGNNQGGDVVYGTGGGGSFANTWIINNLTGTNTPANVSYNAANGANGNPGMNNAERIRFMEFDEARYDYKTDYVDIWKQPYYIAIDANNDKNLEFSLLNGGGPVKLKGRRIAVWSEGDPNDNPRNRIMSWD